MRMSTWICIGLLVAAGGCGEKGGKSAKNRKPKAEGREPNAAKPPGTTIPKGGTPDVYFHQIAAARRKGKATAAIAQLKNLGTTLQAYAAQHDELPAELAGLVKQGMLAKKQLRSPAAPKGFAEAHYLYPAGQFEGLPNAREVIIYENPDIYGGAGSHALFGDYSVKWVPKSELDALLKE